MSEIYHLGVLGLATLLCGWYFRHVTARLEEAESNARECYFKAMAERERCERLRDECVLHAGAAFEAAADMEGYADIAESAEDEDDDDDDDRYRPRF